MRYLDDDDPNTPLEQISISYDLAGNLTHDEEHAYHYDALSRLRSVYTITGVALLHIKYDALGRAVERQVGQNGPVTYYVYDVPTPGGPNGYAVAQEYDDDDNLLREFIHRNGHLRPVAMVDYTDAGAISEGLPETFWYLYDERGSVIAITDNAGAVVEQYRYDPYGGATVYDGTGAVIASWTDPNSWDDRALTPSAIGNPYGFTGHRFSVAGLYETPFRAYSPTLGRWLQRDPLGYVDGINLYQYVVGNPMYWYDPYGLEIERDTVRLGNTIYTHVYENGHYVRSNWVQVANPANEPSTRGNEIDDAISDLTDSYHEDLISSTNWALETGSAHAEDSLNEGLGATFVITVNGSVITYLMKNSLRSPKPPRQCSKPGSAPNGPKTGIVYKRTDPKTGESYIGKTDSPELFEIRKVRHDADLKVTHDYEILGRAEPGKKLDILEESMIRKHGGLAKENGILLNKRHQMSETRYRAAGGGVPNPNR